MTGCDIIPGHRISRPWCLDKGGKKNKLHIRGVGAGVFVHTNTRAVYFSVLFIASLQLNMIKILAFFLPRQKVKWLQVSFLLLILTHYYIFQKCMYAKLVCHFSCVEFWYIFIVLILIILNNTWEQQQHQEVWYVDFLRIPEWLGILFKFLLSYKKVSKKSHKIYVSAEPSVVFQRVVLH